MHIRIPLNAENLGAFLLAGEPVTGVDEDGNTYAVTATLADPGITAEKLGRYLKLVATYNANKALLEQLN